jgi:hypothetical protein
MVLLVEMSYRLATQPELGSRMRSCGQTSTPRRVAWVVAVVALVGGFLAVPADLAADRGGVGPRSGGGGGTPR